jgi:hypothetical protein
MRFAILALAACTTTVDGVPEQAGRCTALEDRTFASLVEMECGLGPNGPVPCTWHLTFSADTATTTRLEWQHSDTGFDAPVTCTGADIKPASTNSFDNMYSGSYDPATQTVTWAGADYR